MNNDQLPIQNYLIVGKDLLEIAKAHADEIEAADKRRFDYARTHGATGVVAYRSHGRAIGISGLLFAKDASLPIGWKFARHNAEPIQGFQYAVPDRRTKQGKQFYAELKVQNRSSFRDPSDQIIRNAVHWPFKDGIWRGDYWYELTFTSVLLSEPQYFLRAPVPPESFYNDQRQPWQVPEGLKPIKEWELQKAIEEHNEAVDRKRTAA